MTFADQIACRTIWQEARNQGPEGMKAVAHVLLNRQASGQWGANLAGVCLAPFQFSGWNPYDHNRVASVSLSDSDPLLLEISGYLEAAKEELDPTRGATHYYAPKVVTQPPWAIDSHMTVEIGDHRFYRDVA